MDSNNNDSFEKNEQRHLEIRRNYEDFENNSQNDENKDKLNDIVITQCILCLAVSVGILILNIFYPDISRELIEKYKQYSGTSDGNAVCDFVSKTVQTLNNLTQ